MKVTVFQFYDKLTNIITPKNVDEIEFHHLKTKGKHYILVSNVVSEAHRKYQTSYKWYCNFWVDDKISMFHTCLTNFQGTLPKNVHGAKFHVSMLENTSFIFWYSDA